MAAFAVFIAGCGGTTPGSPSRTPVVQASPSAAPSATPMTFRLTPEAGVTAGGTMELTATARTTTIELKIQDLQAISSHVSHIHLGSCQSRGGIAFALNPVVADGQGMADARSRLGPTS